MVRSSGRRSLRCKLPGMASPDLRARLAALVRFAVPDEAPAVEVLERRPCHGYAEERIAFSGSEGDVPAFRLVPVGDGPFPGVAAFHQHASEWHWGKSEVVGRAGNPLQAFGPALARRGVVVLAPAGPAAACGCPRPRPPASRSGARAARGSSRAMATGRSTTTRWPTGSSPDGC